ncbi:tRNA1(Val) A37 N6-methylase TrmN6 [Roseibium hamelinense]|uniref:tRNA1(Val) A37 N6-methylase TrmN6 n=1 Tax=Roseibium hamelinense TaxID=150831 RepID=A0A562TB36_9HYPH|nr:methyltransferase [Roseibium hamelinense]MTI45133.1 SAM-dependent methyltransferase [Roseibium hamelinense]TWI90508.1 tRNA1(Val) A37 N6-methylase TrmN6 [Roseibium hamelinense]
MSERPADRDAATTRDAFLGGKVHIRQPKDGWHRAGLDAVYLAAALPEKTQGHLVDLGAGVGTAGFCAAARLPDLTVTLVEIDPVVQDLCGASLRDPENAGFAGRVNMLTADVTAKGAERHASGLVPRLADHVIMNPPYYEIDRFRSSPKNERASAHMLDDRGLEPWVRTASDILRVGGSLTVIFRADGLQHALTVLEGRFGAIDVIAIRPRADAPATRILIRAIRGSRAPLQLLPGLVLHGESSDFLPDAKAVLRDGAGLGLTARR